MTETALSARPSSPASVISPSLFRYLGSSLPESGGTPALQADALLALLGTLGDQPRQRSQDLHAGALELQCAAPPWAVRHLVVVSAGSSRPRSPPLTQA